MLCQFYAYDNDTVKNETGLVYAKSIDYTRSNLMGNIIKFSVDEPASGNAFHL